jgi:hypothetical protein
MPQVQDPIGRAPRAEGRGDTGLGPLSQPGLWVGGQVAADEDAVRVGSHTHPAGQVGVVAAIDARAVDHGMTEPAHLGVHEVLAAGLEIGGLTRSFEPAPRLPGWAPGQREDVVDEIPPLRRGGDVGKRGHGTERREGREAPPDLGGIATSGERPRGRQVSRDDGVASGVQLTLSPPSVWAVAAVAPRGGVEPPAASETGRVRRDARRHGDRRRRGAGECGGESLHVGDHGADLDRREEIAEVRHCAGLKAVGHHPDEVIVGRRLVARGRLVLELAPHEVHRARDE